MKIVVGPLAQLDALIAAHAPSHVITLLAPGSSLPSYPTIHASRHLSLLFHDLASPAPPLSHPDETVISRLLDFGATWDERAPLLVHCWAGVSRSPAAAYILACSRSAPGQERDIALSLRRVSSVATPNPLMVALADAELGRHGRMVAAIAEIGRGTNYENEQAFTLARHGNSWA